MKKVLPWIGLGLLAAAVGGTTFGCSSSSGGGGNNNNTGGTTQLVDGGGGASGSTSTGGTAGNTSNGGAAGSTSNGGAAGNPNMGGAGGTAPVATNLGKQCKTDADCGTGLKCAQPTGTEFGTSGGPANGYCTTSCTSNQDCIAFDPNAQCVRTSATSNAAVCMQSCNPTGTNNCQGRSESLCMGLQATDADGGVVDSGAPIYACEPWCGSDADCGGTLHCDLSTGLCSATAHTGDPIGTNCNPQSVQEGGTNTCAGLCVGFIGDPPDVGSCGTFCDPNSFPTKIGQCGSSSAPGSKQDAACLFGSSTNKALGFCDQLCNCDSDCRTSNNVCAPWTTIGATAAQASQLTAAFGQAGFCSPKNGGPDGGTVTGIPTCPAGSGGSGGASDGGI